MEASYGCSGDQVKHPFDQGRCMLVAVSETERSTAAVERWTWWPVLAFLGVVALMSVLVLIEAHELHIAPAA